MMADEESPVPQSPISEEEVAALLEKKDGKDAVGVKPYDFTLNRINRTQLPMLEVVNKTFAARAGLSLSALLGRDAIVHFESIESVKSADVQAALPTPASLAVVRLKPLAGLAYVSVEPQLLLTLLDGFFGGSGRENTDMQSAAAPAAQRFLSLMLRNFAPDVTAAWTPVMPMELELLKLETNPRLVQFGAPQEPVVVCKFNVEFAARTGVMNWLLPESLLAPIRETLSSELIGRPARKQDPWGPALGATLREVQFEMRAVLAEAQISLRELVQLSPGDIIPMEPPQEATFLAGDVPVFHGRFGVSQGRNALKIVSGASR